MSNKQISIDEKKIQLQQAILQLSKKDQELFKDVDWSDLLNPQNELYYKAEEIAKTLGKGWTSTKVNEVLTEMDYQVYWKKDYYPTPKGAKSGCTHRAIMLESGEKSTFFRFSLVWTIDIIDRIKEYLESEEKQNAKK